jgi:ABC-type branched-subunit amino acid transport system substrate-binding protein
MTNGRRCVALALIAALLMAACGSTLQESGSGSVAAGDGLGDSSSDGLGGDSEDGLGSGLGSADGTSGDLTSGGAGFDGDGLAGTGGGGTASGGGSGTAGVGGTAAAKNTGPIKVGVIGVDVTALFAVFGATGNSGSIYDGFNRFLEYMNKTGGIAGRQIEPVYETIDIAEDYNAAAQRACEKFTTDNKVDFVMPTGWNEVLLSCLRKRGVAAFEGGTWTNDRGTLDHPNWITPFAVPVNRYTPALLDFGMAEGFIKRGDTVGVLYEDCPWGSRVYNGVVKTTASKHGLKTVPATTKCVENLVNDIGPATNQIQQAALKFNSSGVTHVLTVTGAEGFFIGQFQKAADQQRYHPKYFFSSNGFPYNNSSPESRAVRWETVDFPNMLGLGFMPYIDVGHTAQPANDAQAAKQAKCREADPQTGTQNAASAPARAQATAGFYGLCDLFLLIREIARVNGGRFDIASLRSGYRSVIGTATSAMLTGGRHQMVGDRLEAGGFMQPVRFDNGAPPPVYFGSLRSVT